MPTHIKGTDTQKKKKFKSLTPSKSPAPLDEGTRSCCRRLVGHNKRRRKTNSDTVNGMR
jgi:hypothetical protein